MKKNGWQVERWFYFSCRSGEARPQSRRVNATRCCCSTSEKERSHNRRGDPGPDEGGTDPAKQEKEERKQEIKEVAQKGDFLPGS